MLRCILHTTGLDACVLLPAPYLPRLLTPPAPATWPPQAHSMSLAALVLHPTKPILVTASDDKSWKMWHLPAGDLIMCGEGHKDWVAGVDFHPGGTSLASASGGGWHVLSWCL